MIFFFVINFMRQKKKNALEADKLCFKYYFEQEKSSERLPVDIKVDWGKQHILEAQQKFESL